MPLRVGLSAADRRLLPEGRLSGPMPWVIAIMMFLTVLAAAVGLGLGAAAEELGSDLANRLTVQIVEANPDRRGAQTRAALDALAAMPGVARATRISDDEIARLLEPWLGGIDQADALPVPALIDVDLHPGGSASAVAARLTKIAPAARVDEHARSLAPLGNLIKALRWLAFGLVVLMAAAAAAAVVLAARAALNTHRPTIDVMHLLGATDEQIARLFQRRIALDALFSGLIGLAGAGVVILLIGGRIAALGSELLGSIALPWPAWLALAMLPFAGTLLAMAAARLTVLNALRRFL